MLGSSLLQPPRCQRHPRIERATRSGQCFIPMPHQSLVFKIKLSKLKQVVGKRLTLCEMLFETSKTTIHGVPTRVDNLRVRQYRFNETNVCKVVRHFVREKRRAFSMASRLFNILETQRLELLDREFLHALREHFACSRFSKALRNHRDIG